MPTKQTTCIADTNKPSEWSDLVRDCTGAHSYQLRYRTGGRAPGYRDLGKRVSIHVGAQAGVSVCLDPDAVAQSAWDSVMDHWGTVAERGGRVCTYTLVLFDDKDGEIASTNPMRVSATSEPEAPADERVSASWERQCQVFHAQAKSSSAQTTALLAALTPMLTTAGELLRQAAEQSAKSAPDDPRAGLAQAAADAHVRGLRVQEAGATIRTLLTLGAGMGATLLDGDGDGPPIDVLVELVGSGHVQAIGAVLRGDRTAARESGVDASCVAFWAWCSDTQ